MQIKQSNKILSTLYLKLSRKIQKINFNDYLINKIINSTQSIRYKDVDLIFTIPNRINRFRVNTFSSKEPETLDWIDAIPEGAVLWDIGANVGLYTCYAAKARNCKVFSFEPSVFNLEWLARNIYINNLTKHVTIIPLPLTEKLTQSTLNMSRIQWGGSLSTFAENYGDDGQILDKNFEFQTIGLSMNDAIQILKIQPPDFIKIDVDGIEHLILKGGIQILENVKGLLVEINEEFEKQAIDATMYLKNSGLILKEKRHSDYFEYTRRSNSYNQIWYRLKT